MLKILICVFVSCACLLIQVSGHCILNVQNVSPIFVKNIGSKSVILKKKAGMFKLGEMESIHAYCSTGVMLPSYRSSDQFAGNMELNCMSNSLLRYRTNDLKNFVNIGRSDVTINCQGSSTQLQLFESKQVLPNCERYSTYAIGASPTQFENIKVAGICYDLDTLTVKYVNHLAHQPKYDIISAENASQVPHVNLSQKIDNFDFYIDYLSQEQFSEAYKLAKAKNDLLATVDLDYMNLIQNDNLSADLKDYNKMLSIVWWRNLRVGNWKFLLNALSLHAEGENYVVYTGTHGSVSMPAPEGSCNDVTELSVEANGITVRTPEYIWLYLHSPQGNVSDEVVFIGYNSPFYSSADTVIFCEDICDSIPWLRGTLFSRVRRMPIFGAMFCCKPEDVHQRFVPFPWQSPDALSQEIKPTTAKSLPFPFHT